MTHKKEEFIPLEANRVKIYSCGPTVYNFIHIGNARPMVVFDAVRRYFEYKKYDVVYVTNFTDVDDKIINRANEEGVNAIEIALRYSEEAMTDERGLNISPPTHRPRVTREMPAILDMIGVLFDKGYAYEKKGTVYFDTQKFDGYGKLSKKNIDELEAGSRVGIDGEKRGVSDFVLWKPAKPGEPKWSSHWGEGRPGWHIECSAMIKRYLGDSIDIHGGGEDLIFPHHENEIAQSECANGAVFVKYWMHNGFLNIDNQKMSKSEGNFFTVREISEKFSYDVMRFFILSAHYRTPLNFSAETMRQAENSLNRVKNCVKAVGHMAETAKTDALSDGERALIARLDDFTDSFETSMDDDFNTADAISSIFELVRFANVNVSEKSSKVFARTVLDRITLLCGVLGVVPEQNGEHGVDAAFVEQKIDERQQARKNKDFAKADAIRAELNALGITLEDTAVGVRWTV
jgi:cysteinyl-tRNA synthetase